MREEILDLVEEDHDEVDVLLGRPEGTSFGEGAGLLDEVVTALARNQTAEEAIVHPATPDAVDDLLPS